MRASRMSAQIRSWRIPASRPAGHTEKKQIRQLQPSAILAMLFLVGYAGGVLLCRTSVPSIGTLFAEYYTDPAQFSAFPEVFFSGAAALFLQCCMIVLCGSSVAGVALLYLFFLGKGAMLGICAAAIYVMQGLRGLVVYWLLTCLTDVAQLLLLLWLAKAACDLSMSLLRSLMDGGSVRGALKARAQMLLYRSGMALVTGAVCTAFGAGSAVLFAAVLL